MLIREIVESFGQEEISAALSHADPAAQSAAVLRLLHSQTTSDKKRADMRDEVARVAVIRDGKKRTEELSKILYKWMLSLGGLPTGIQTSKGRKGIGYSR